MPLIAPVIQEQLSAEIMIQLESAFGATSDATTGASSHKKLADAIAEAVAKVMVMQLTTMAIIAPGIPTAGSPSAQVTVGPGKIM